MTTKTFYDNLKASQKHEHGACIVAGQAQGKTFFLKDQPKWVDADDMIGQYPPSQVKAKAKLVEELVSLGAWVITSTWWTLEAFGNDVAVVSISEDRLRERAKAKKFNFEEAKSQAEKLEAVAQKSKVPIFKSFEEATSHLVLKLTKTYTTI